MATATALSAAVIGGLLGGRAPDAAAEPRQPDAGGAGAAETPAAEAALRDAVWPRPQQLRAGDGEVHAGGQAVLVTPEDADPRALAELREVLRSFGVREFTRVRPGAPLPATGLVVHAEQAPAGPAGVAGPPPRRSAADAALRALGAGEQADLPAGGYRLAAGQYGGRDVVALAGTDAAGLFHGVQTLRELARAARTEGTLPTVSVRDWPGTAVRGVAENHYGRPWSHEQRLAQLDFMGRTKLNRYLYAPGDDRYRQADWREAYPAGQRARFRELAERARANHVTLAWAVAPGQNFCFSSGRDRKDLIAKADAMWALGVRAFQLQFQDVSYSEWACGEDADEYGTGPEAAARAQAETANALAAHLSRRHPDAAPLSLLPTEYYQDGATDYRSALAGELDERVEVAWSGVGAVPREITGGQLRAAQAAFGGHPLVTQDNYPVNDYARDRIFLGPYDGRDPAVAAGSAGVLASGMEQPAASRVPLFTVADYAWNPRAYDPDAAWRAAVRDLAADAPDPARAGAALAALAGNSASSELGAQESAYLRPLIADFWGERERASGGRQDAEKAARRLRDAFTVMRRAPDELAPLADGTFGDEVRPWLKRLARYGAAGERAVDMVTAQAAGRHEEAWQARLELQRLAGEAGLPHSAPARTWEGPPGGVVGAGVLDAFLSRALTDSDSWLGAGGAAGRGADAGASAAGGAEPLPGSSVAAAADGRPATAYEAARPPSPGTHEALVVEFDRQPLRAVTVLTQPGTGTRAEVQIRVRDKGRPAWRPVGGLDGGGWTELPAERADADAVRLVWAAGTTAPVVHEVVPWSAAEPAARLSLSRDEADVTIGGAPVVVDAELSARRPGDAGGRVTAKAPKGLEAEVPGEVRIARGTTARARIGIRATKDVAPGTYEIPVRLEDGDDAQVRTVTVHAYPAVGGPDLARAGRASSSADETPDFPAAAVADGDPGTRWSSPVEDGAWVQVRLAEPARVGEVALRWESAYAKRYRVQVSADGRRWRTAAAVDDGGGGRESVRMDERDVRYVRVQGVERATEFGYSLYALEVRAVHD
ncbi:beta-N-acetylglucosaminidase domain-containing protein [Streptomyces sp. WMMC500]|uniref:beta-N-acetylglucosaminidase domain-containing protein n=1 Tax=Streptomyces sp. WMMC500 TaxID=3015154 RepID=UPI00248CBE61|nr:beta-N-acetylglucosaminidase domain-containing protein [Streptomyces sp. WMMC500]WBB59299.1 beta-N-acetylglucosaminidase domain-containing protein [Streptomyces sp. WMMC500]